jgi:pyruvate/2-oxoglutarate dehydrogenase complex dihydrolipoamide acyltransferase (E2) component
MGAADDRVAELLDRWLASVELHARYLSLDDTAYASVEDWPQHQRPTRWLVDIARARCEDLKRQLAERRARRDEGFADALELMAFLTNLMGSEHLERFIPLATGRPPKRRPVAAPAPAPVPPAATPAPKPSKPAAVASDAASVTGTVEVAKPAAAERASSRAKPSASATGRHARSGSTVRHGRPQGSAPRKAASEPAQSAKSPAPPKSTAARSATPPGDRAVATVIADAVRMLNWGREWPQLAGLITRLAGRPSEKEVWEILSQHRATIEAQAEHQA